MIKQAKQEMIKNKKIFILIGVVLIATIIFYVAIFSFSDTATYYTSWTAILSSTNAKADSWTISAKIANGNAIRRNINLNSDNFNSMHIENTNSDGNVSLIITQGNIEKIINIDREFSESIDMSDFKPGRVKLHLNFENAKDVKTNINWQ